MLKNGTNLDIIKLYLFNKRQRIPKGQSKTDNTEKLTTYSTQDKEQQNIHTTQCVRHHNTEANTNNVNKTWALLQIAEGKDEPL